MLPEALPHPAPPVCVYLGLPCSPAMVVHNKPVDLADSDVIDDSILVFSAAKLPRPSGPQAMRPAATQVQVRCCGSKGGP